MLDFQHADCCSQGMRVRVVGTHTPAMILKGTQVPLDLESLEGHKVLCLSGNVIWLPGVPLQVETRHMPRGRVPGG